VGTRREREVGNDERRREEWRLWEKRNRAVERRVVREWEVVLGRHFDTGGLRRGVSRSWFGWRAKVE